MEYEAGIERELPDILRLAVARQQPNPAGCFSVYRQGKPCPAITVNVQKGEVIEVS